MVEIFDWFSKWDFEADVNFPLMEGEYPVVMGDIEVVKREEDVTALKDN